MNNIQVFTNQLFGNVTVLNIKGESWFIGNEIASIMGYTRPRDAVHDHVYEEDKGSAKLPLPRGGMQETTIINESGLYSLIFSSKLPSARQFKHWVTSEVLPTMRKLGFDQSLQLLQNEVQRLQEENTYLNVSNIANKQERSFLEYNIINSPYVPEEEKVKIFVYDPSELNPEIDIQPSIINFKSKYGID